MRLKTILLGSAAAFALASGSAQAADLSIAEPVDYVRVCDAFGAGYFYIPGTDTCLRIGGFVRFDTIFAEDAVDFDPIDQTRDYDFKTRAHIDIEARSQTDWGPLVAFIALEGDLGINDSEDLLVDEAYLSIGPFLAGHVESAFSWGGGYTSIYGLDDGVPFTAFTDDDINQVQLSWAMNGFGLILAVEDGAERFESWTGAALGPLAAFGGALAGDIPHLVAAITADGNGWNAKAAFLYASVDDGGTNTVDAVLGVHGGVEINVFGDDQVMLAGSYLNLEDVGTLWSALGSFVHYWQSNLSSAITVRYDSFGDSDFVADDDTWSVAFETSFSPVQDLWVRGGILYEEADDSVEGTIRIQRNFGG